MPVPGAFAFIVAARRPMAAVAAMPEEMHCHHRSRDREENPVLRQPFHASTPSMEKFGW
jgi:hypothetical protein